MSDGSLEYALEGDAGSLKDAFASAQGASQMLGQSVITLREKFQIVATASDVLIRTAGHFVNAGTAAAEFESKIKGLGLSMQGMSSGQLESTLNRTRDQLKELTTVSWTLEGGIGAVKEAWQKLFTGTTDRIQGITKALFEADAAYKELIGRGEQDLKAQEALIEGRRQDAEMIKAKGKASQEVAALEARLSGANHEKERAQIQELIAQAKKKGEYDLILIAQRFAKETAAQDAIAEGEAAITQAVVERAPAHEEIAESMASVAESTAELNRAVEAEWQNLSRGTREVHDQRLAQEEIALTLEAQTRQREAGLTTEQKLKQYSDGIGAALVTNVDLAERMRAAMEGSSAAVKTTSDNWDAVIRKVDASGTNWAKIQEKVGGIGTSVGAIVKVQTQHTTEVRHTREAYEALDTVVGQRMLSTLNRVLSTLQAIAGQARAAGTAVAVLQ